MTFYKLHYDMSIYSCKIIISVIIHENDCKYANKYYKSYYYLIHYIFINTL